MARTESRMLELGTPAPDFVLPTVYPVDGEATVATFADADVLVVMFICNHCPYVRVIEDRLVALAEQYQPRGVQFIAVSSNDADAYPDDAPNALAARARSRAYPFPYLYDETQDVARAFGAVCTPDFFVYDADRRLVYRGRLDDANPSRPVPTTRDLADALDALLSGQPVSPEQIPSVGCNIKWR